jgi:hypothetical protein
VRPPTVNVTDSGTVSPKFSMYYYF